MPGKPPPSAVSWNASEGHVDFAGHDMFRILYFVVIVGGLLWILQTRPIWLEPTRALQEPPHRAAGDADWQHDEDARADETLRRTRIVAIATLGVMAAGEVWCLLAGRLKIFHRT
jgi:hypothetical protein